MAAKPKDNLVEENKEEEKRKSPDYKEIHNESFEEIAAKGAEEKKDESVKEEETTQPETPKEPEEVAQPEAPPTPPVDKEALKAEVSAEVTQKLVESLTGKPKDQEEVYPWVKENRTPNDKDVLDYVKDRAKAEVLADLNKESEEAAQEETSKAEQEKQRIEGLNKYWDDELVDMEKSGLIPEVKDANNENDPGRKARLELTQKMYELSQEAQKQGKAYISSYKSLYVDHFVGKKWDEQPAGADAPVNGVTRNTTSEGGNDYSYADIHKPSLRDIYLGKK